MGERGVKGGKGGVKTLHQLNTFHTVIYCGCAHDAPWP